MVLFQEPPLVYHAVAFIAATEQIFFRKANVFPNLQRITLYEVGELALIVPRFAVLAMCPPSYHIASILYLCTGVQQG